jgi:hypothetical protein
MGGGNEIELIAQNLGFQISRLGAGGFWRSGNILPLVGGEQTAHQPGKDPPMGAVGGAPQVCLYFGPEAIRRCTCN